MTNAQIGYKIKAAVKFKIKSKYKISLNGPFSCTNENKRCLLCASAQPTICTSKGMGFCFCFFVLFLQSLGQMESVCNAFEV